MAEDWPEAQVGEAPARSPGDAEEARMDEEMTNLLGFLGGNGATWPWDPQIHILFYVSSFIIYILFYFYDLRD